MASTYLLSCASEAYCSPWFYHWWKILNLFPFPSLCLFLILPRWTSKDTGLSRVLFYSSAKVFAVCCWLKRWHCPPFLYDTSTLLQEFQKVPSQWKAFSDASSILTQLLAQWLECWGSCHREEAPGLPTHEAALDRKCLRTCPCRWGSFWGNLPENLLQVTSFWGAGGHSLCSSQKPPVALSLLISCGLRSPSLVSEVSWLWRFLTQLACGHS